jgi:hypothetical protein
MIRPVTIKRESIINESPGYVWSVIEPADNISSWFQLADRTELISGSGKGRRQRMYVKWGGKQVEIEQEVVDYEPMKLIRWKHTKELIDGQPAPLISDEVFFTVKLSPAGEATSVILLSENFPAGFVNRLLIQIIAKPRIAAALNKSLAMLSGQI